MSVKQPLDILFRLFEAWSGRPPLQVIRLAPSGSERAYYRLRHEEITAIGTWHPMIEENKAFVYFSRHFRAHGIHVPEILAVDHTANVYLQEDLGDVSLLSLAEKNTASNDLPDDLQELYRKSLSELVRFQVVAGKDLDYNVCYPGPAFDQRSMTWDLNYFKYYFLKLHAGFNEAKLEEDFTTLIRYLGQADASWFMYRDFQARNILIRDNQPWFIDYQGGRKGPLQYDVASLLFQVKANLPAARREELLNYYLDVLSAHIHVDKTAFKALYNGFVLIRLLQVLGAYGYRGLIEKKPHFLVSIPPALKSLSWWIKNTTLPIDLPELMKALISLSELSKYSTAKPGTVEKGLTIHIASFSYKNGLPVDLSGHGGGFIFDCRALPNPGRDEQYRAYNGRDKIIIDYMENQPQVSLFLDNARNLIKQSVENYMERNFNHLSFSFGCTGGQHRSVYCAEIMAAFIHEHYPRVKVDLQHHMLSNS